MNKIINFGAMLTIAAGAVTFNSSCSSNDVPSYDPSAEKTALYQENFVKTFGNIDPKNDWGFGQDIPCAPKPTKGVNANANEWGGYVEVPEPLTEAQIATVTNWFASHPNPQGIAVNWSDFFVQQVSSTDYGKNMDLLTCGTAEEHINNFNGGDGSTNGNVCYWQDPNDQNNRLYRSDKIQFMVNSSTECFGYHESRGTFNQQYNDKYVIIPGSMIDSSVAGMYFVGFDYNSSKGPNSPENIDADGYYNDWIVKITPGLYTPKGQRIMCEDLGTTADFDFNDIVIDVYNDWKGYPGNEWSGATIVTVRAAGGTLPATVAGKDIHKLFGVDTKDMVNTGIKTAPVAIFRIPQVNNAKDIQIMVGNDGGTWELKTATGAAPQKILVPSTTKWSKEYKNIVKSYPDFEKYVQNAADNGQWYKNIADNNELY